MTGARDLDLFADVTEFPSGQARRQYGQLVGLDPIKERLSKRARLMLNPGLVEQWSQQHHGGHIALVDSLAASAPLFVFAGDVGTGKTALAESFGDNVARQENIDITLYRLSLSARGSGAVGEMTKLLAAAFAHVIEAARKSVRGNGHVQSGTILLIDEADALAQSRELGQMHHEDRAGVNALIRGIDDLAAVPAAAVVVMCTNRLDAIDPAVRRRAAEVFEFRRPNFEQRLAILQQGLGDAGLTDQELGCLAEITGEGPGGRWGYTYSDLRQRLLPAILIDAFPNHPVTFERAREVAQEMSPTPPFQAEQTNGNVGKGHLGA